MKEKYVVLTRVWDINGFNVGKIGGNMFICDNCNRVLNEISQNEPCPWCGGDAVSHEIEVHYNPKIDKWDFECSCGTAALYISTLKRAKELSEHHVNLNGRTYYS